jgi:hypothetical protein
MSCNLRNLRMRFLFHGHSFHKAQQ